MADEPPATKTELTAKETKEALNTLRRNRYIVYVCAHPRCRRPPIVVLSLLAAMIIVYYAAGEYNVPGPSAMALIFRPRTADRSEDWYRSLSAMFSHVSDNHLWMNSIMLLLLGTLFELTEGILHTLTLIWGAGNLGFALHGVYKPQVMVRGMSGACYGIIFAQISLLALNWAEMPFRWIRVLFILVLGGADVISYVSGPDRGLSYEAHFFGALAGICVALVLGRNVRLRKWEISMTWAGCAGYCVLLVVAFIGDQLYPALLASAALPVLIGYAIYLTPRACRLQCCRPDAQITDPLEKQLAHEVEQAQQSV